jgi:hypothetical protein
MLQTPHGIHEWRLLGLNLFLKECAFDFSSHDKTSHITLRFSILVMCLFPIICTWTVAKQYQPTVAHAGVAHCYIYDSIVNIYIYIHILHIYIVHVYHLFWAVSFQIPILAGSVVSIVVRDRSWPASECLGIIGMRHCSPCFGSWCWLSWPFMCLGLSWPTGSSSRKSIFGRHHEASVVACNQHNYDSSY